MLNERNTLLEDDGIEEEILVEEECSVAQAVWGDIQGNIENQTDLQNALDAKQDSLTEAQLNAVNSGITAGKVATYDGYADQIASKADQSALNAETIARGEADTALGTRIDNEALARQSADNGLQSQIDAITSKSDVVDVVANYAALQAYDTSTLGNNDVVKVLDDETHEDALTYYRWSTTTQTWTYIGQEAPYYSKGQMDVMLQGKQDTLTAGANIQIQNGTISATDTTYTNGNGLNLNGTEFSADTDVLATKEDLESYYTKPEADNLLAPKLEAEVVAELPTTGIEGKLYLTPKAHTTQTATGNPITATVAEEAGKIESFQLDGDTFQQTYTGKNLLNVERKWSITAGAGVTVTDGADGSLILNGTVTAREDIRLYSSSDRFTLESGKTVTMSREPYSSWNLIWHRFTSESGTGTSDVKYFDPGASSFTYTTLDTDYGYQFIMRLPVGATFNNTHVYLQLEAGSTASSFEPYVGGTPSPNPDYPQPIQTVTGLQTVEIQGKNLLRQPYTGGTVGTGLTWTVADDGTIHVVGTIGGGNKSYYLYNRSQSDFDMPEIPAGTYKVFWSITGSGSSPRITIQDANGYHNSNASNEVTIATSAKPTNIYIQFTGSQSGDVDLYIKPMIVPSDQADVYAPYSHQTLPLDLGNIQLCGLGDDGNGNPLYKDRIYKDGNDWKVHKATANRTLSGSSYWATDSLGRYYTNSISDYSRSNNAPVSSHFEGVSNVTAMGDTPDGKIAFNNGTADRIYIGKFDKFTSTSVLTQWLIENTPSIYYALATPTDTAITDTTLIAQLEAIRTASLQNGANTITNTATGSNLAGDMEIGYYGFAPRNRYDKWLWLDINNEYEQLNNPDTSSTLSTLSTRSLGTETITLKKGEAEPIEDKTELPTILDDKTEETEETETTEPEESDGTDER